MHSVADGDSARVDTGYAYSRNGNLALLADFSGTTAYTYDQVNLPKTIRAPSDERPYEFQYQPDYQLKELRLPNQISQDYEYKDDHLRLIKFGAEGSDPIPDIELDYAKSDKPGPDPLQDLLKTRTFGKKKTRFSYDELNRLESAVTPDDPGPSYRYEYDGASNLKQIDISGKTRKLDFNAPDEVIDEDGRDYQYDKAGAVKDDPRNVFSYNPLAQTDRIDPVGRPAEAQRYTGSGQARRIGAGNDLFAYDQLGLSVRLRLDDRFTYLTRGIPIGLSKPAGDPITSATVRGQPLGQRDLGGQNFYYLTDQQGSVIAVTDADGKVVREYEYEPYGEIADQSGNGPAGLVRFTGEQFDSTSGLYKIGARFYDPAIGRWTQRDSVLQPFDPVNSNPYVYAGADPVNLSDPSGELVFLAPVAVVVASVAVRAIATRVATSAVATSFGAGYTRFGTSIPGQVTLSGNGTFLANQIGSRTAPPLCAPFDFDCP